MSLLTEVQELTKAALETTGDYEFNLTIETIKEAANKGQPYCIRYADVESGMADRLYSKLIAEGFDVRTNAATILSGTAKLHIYWSQ